MKGEYKTWSRKEVRTVKEMFSEGYTYDEVCESIGRTKLSLRRFCYRNKIRKKDYDKTQ